ncbi:VPLPA-CTERM sorting domain-containing protein [Roseobacter sp. S98]|uniref:VPLPA-CTERM sorting domain-containing protein n=1 Tax=Roseobacter algicola (ex Choi et al. 2025) (nom. illeg.) TaxID=3092138 RepID=UPI0035C6DCCB
MLKKLLSVAFAAGLMATGASAATLTNGFTFGVTEGNGQNRATVVGTTDLDVDSTGPINLGILSAGDVFGVYGRIVGAVDRFSFTFKAAKDFEIAFDLDGYEVFDSGKSGPTSFVETSGLINQALLGNENNTGGKRVKFSLAGAGGTDETFRTTNLFGPSVTDADRVLFTGTEGGFYTFSIDGLGENTAALYDINITTTPVPLPAGVLLLVTGVAGLGFMRRRKTA